MYELQFMIWYKTTSKLLNIEQPSINPIFCVLYFQTQYPTHHPPNSTSQGIQFKASLAKKKRYSKC